MIKIQISEDKMNSLLDKHWDWFKTTVPMCKRMGENGKTFGAPCERMTLIKEELRNNGVVADITDDYIENLIRANHEDCRSYIEELKSIRPERKSVLLHYFGYKEWIKPKYDWNAYVYMQELEVRVCPYCNKNYIDYSFKGKDALIPRSPFDHFFPKTVFPFLSCSLWNLIPCCHTCNSAKRAETKEFIYPYEEEFGENGKFCLVNKSGTKYDEEKFRDPIVDNYEIKLHGNGSLEEKVKQSDDKFHLSKRYSQDSFFIRDLIDKIHLYATDASCRNVKYYKMKKQTFFNVHFNLPRTENEIYPYQKITKDILKQSGQFKNWLE